MKTKAKDMIRMIGGDVMTLGEALDAGRLRLKKDDYYDPPRFFATDDQESWEVGETLYKSRMKQPLVFGGDK